MTWNAHTVYRSLHTKFLLNYFIIKQCFFSFCHICIRRAIPDINSKVYTSLGSTYFEMSSTIPKICGVGLMYSTLIPLFTFCVLKVPSVIYDSDSFLQFRRIFLLRILALTPGIQFFWLHYILSLFIYFLIFTELSGSHFYQMIKSLSSLHIWNFISLTAYAVPDWTICIFDIFFDEGKNGV